MRLHITLDDIPEFESFQSIWLALRGMAWSITNTPLGESLPEDVGQGLLDAIHSFEQALIVPIRKEEPWLRQRSQRREQYIFGPFTELLEQSAEQREGA